MAVLGRNPCSIGNIASHPSPITLSETDVKIISYALASVAEEMISKKLIDPQRTFSFHCSSEAVFEKLSQIADPGLKTAIELGLEWVYLARITTDSRNCFLAYWTALELILTQLSPREEAVFAKYVAPGCVEQMKSELDAVLEKYICNADARVRLSQYISQAKATSDIDRWVKALNDIGVKFQGKPITDSQLKDFKLYRDTLVHNGGIASERYKKKIPENPLKNVPIFD